MQFIFENIQWIFSGIGVVIITGIFSYLAKNKNNSDLSDINVHRSKQVVIKNNKNEKIDVHSSEKVTIEGNLND